LLVVADFGQILSLECLATTRLGGVNIHGSLLPKYRGAAPIAWAVYHGETETGVSIIQVTPQLDAGGLLLQGSIPIGPDETAGELESTLSQLGAQLVLKAVDGLERGAILPKPQDPKLVTKAPRLKKEDGRIHWERTAPQIHNQVRALQPWPIAFTDWHRAQGAPVRLQILRTRPLPASREAAEPGSVGEAAAGRLLVATGAGDLEILELKPAGKKAMDAATFLRGNKLASNDRFS
jgi:methionyl-tRNA formyltransferase